MTALKIAISVGELSADEHTSFIVQDLKCMAPDIEIRGMGGRNMRAAGVKTDVDSEKSASVMGFQETLGSIGKVIDAMKRLKKLLREWRPDALLLVDYAEFNMHLGKYAHSIGIPVLYFITPQVWAWRSGRVRTIGRIANRAVVLFPFEQEFFERNGFGGSLFLGHPFVDRLPKGPMNAEERARVLSENGLDPARPVIAIFPGSRWSEIERHLTPMLEGIRMVQDQHPEIQAAVAIAPSVRGRGIEEILAGTSGVRRFNGSSIDLLRSADIGLLKSGTSNLQAVFAGLPFTMFYKSSALTAVIVRKFVRIKEYSIVNVIRPGTVVEIIQEEGTAERVAREVKSLLYDAKRRAELQAKFREIIGQLSFDGEIPALADCTTSSARTAKTLLDLARSAAQ
jgi:lipid-A-disaccharide synthase